MKRMVSFFIVFFIMAALVKDAYAQYNPNPLNLNSDEYNNVIVSEYLDSIWKLSQLDIVNNPHKKWDSDDYICRRDVFEMAYIVCNRGSRELCSKAEVALYAESLSDSPEKVFADLKPNTYDFNLAYGLLYNSNLYRGKINENNVLVADFDEYITYNEALVVLARLLVADWRTDDKIFSCLESAGEYVYYELFCDLGLINSNTLVSYSSLELYPENLNNKITAAEFMHLLHSTLYTPILSSSDFGDRVYGFRYIDYIHDFKNDSRDNEYIYIP